MITHFCLFVLILRSNRAWRDIHDLPHTQPQSSFFTSFAYRSDGRRNAITAKNVSGGL